MRIGELARRSGISASRIRFYEARRIGPHAVRGENGYRDYPVEAVAVLDFINRGQALGFTLAELGAALSASERGMPAGIDLLAGLHRKHEELGRHIRVATARRKKIGRLIAELQSCEQEPA